MDNRFALDSARAAYKTAAMGAYDCSETTFIAKPAAELYDMVVDVTRMGEWSPVTKQAWWNEQHAPGQLGARFTGRNVVGERSWETVCEVVTAERGREFAFEVTPMQTPQALAFFTWTDDPRLVRWSYSFSEKEGGTEVTESWLHLEDGIAYVKERFGEGTDEEITKRRETASNGMRETLASLKKAAEAS